MTGMAANMMTMSLLISTLLQDAARNHRTTEIVSRIGATVHRYTYRDAEARARQLANALAALDVGEGDKVGTLAWNDHRHFELYYAVAGSGAICHTINPRLFPEQLAYIINHGASKVMFLDPEFLPLAERLASDCPNINTWVVLDQPGQQYTLPGQVLLRYEELLAAQDSAYTWPTFDENAASNLCYTSGTTGNPKGVLYSHRSTVLHAFACALPDSQNLSASEVVMPVVPLFHANAWEIPYSAPLVGAKLVLPGSRLDGASLYQLVEQEGVTLSVGVPTVWLNVLRYMQENDLRFSTLRRLLIGGAAMPAVGFDGYAALGVKVFQGWGMTETAALTTCTAPKAAHRLLDEKALQRQVYQGQGRPVAGAQTRIVDELGEELAWDNAQSGYLQARAPWIIERYFGSPESALEASWLPTGDMARIDADGFVTITDRAKDVVKSGGEWISSIEIENIAVAHPDVLHAACIAATHPKWGERPLLVAVKAPGTDLTAQALLHTYEGKVAKWCIPDDVVFIDAMPMTATGKLFKLQLRDMFKDYLTAKQETR